MASKANLVKDFNTKIQNREGIVMDFIEFTGKTVDDALTNALG